MQCKVWNDSNFTWREKFKNKEIVIEPHSYIMMNRDDAVDFEGKFVVPKLDANRQIVPESQKMIRVEGAYGPHLYEKKPEARRFVCQADGREFASEAELNDYVKANWRTSMSEPDSLDEQAPRKRGRPPKNATSTEGL
jgi:hypothetical protein